MLHVEKDHVELYQLPEEIYRYCICSQKLFPRKSPNIFGVESGYAAGYLGHQIHSSVFLNKDQSLSLWKTKDDTWNIYFSP